MVPVHGHFPHSELCPPRQIKQLDVETKPRGLGFFKNRPANIETEGFEPALGIPKRKAGGNAHDEVENATALFSPPGLVMADQAPVQGARTKRDVHLPGRDGLDQSRRIIDGRRQIRIGKQADGPAGSQQARAHRCPFAAVGSVDPSLTTMTSLSGLTRPR